MPNATISQVKVGNTTYDICDATARDITSHFKIVDCTNSAAVTFSKPATNRQVGAFDNVLCDIVTDAYAAANNTTLQDILDEGFLPTSIIWHSMLDDMVLDYAVPWSSLYPFPHMRIAAVTTKERAFAAKGCVMKTLFFKPFS